MPPLKDFMAWFPALPRLLVHAQRVGWRTAVEVRPSGVFVLLRPWQRVRLSSWSDFRVMRKRICSYDQLADINGIHWNLLENIYLHLPECLDTATLTKRNALIELRPALAPMLVPAVFYAPPFLHEPAVLPILS